MDQRLYKSQQGDQTMKVVSLFSGIGGLDKGFEDAGYELIWANDFDKYAVQTYRANYDNEIARIFNRFPQLNVSEVARSMGIHKSLLSKYIYGIKKPSKQQKEQIKQYIRLLGQDLMAI